jgi:hypothetical protein
MPSGLMKWIGRSLLWSGLRPPFCSSELGKGKRPTPRRGPAMNLDKLDEMSVPGLCTRQLKRTEFAWNAKAYIEKN